MNGRGGGRVSNFQLFLKALWEELKPGGRDLGEALRSSINFAPKFYIQIGSFTLPVTGPMISLLAAVYFYTRIIGFRRSC